MNSMLVLRMRDVGICLKASKKHNILLTKIQLQKLIYFVDSISSFLYIVSVKHGHSTYLYGPYDRKIQNAIDSLVIRGLADITNIKHTSSDSISCQYYLTSCGVEWTDNLIYNNASSKMVYSIAYNTISSLSKRNLLSHLVELIYAEPIFTKNQRKGYGVNLDFSNLEENNIFNYLMVVLNTYKIEKDKHISHVCDLAVDYLNQRRIALAAELLEEV